MYDLAIIGSGPAGYSAAFEAIRHKMSVILFERDLLGGTCLNRGCVPTKYLLHVARKYYEAERNNDGIEFQSIKLDYTKTKMQEIIKGLRYGLDNNLRKSGVKLILGDANLKSQNVINCDGIDYSAKNIIIATGTIPGSPIIKSGKSSSDILNLDFVPKKLHIVGGGSISVEFAEIFKMFGSDVRISIRGDRILRTWDKELSVGLTQSLKKMGVQINKECNIEALQLSTDEIILSATGRNPLIPKAASSFFDIGEKGGIIVDHNFQTKSETIFAAGDVIEGSCQLAHAAMDQGRQIVRYISDKKSIKEKSVPKCIYVNQEIASVGITEEEAKSSNLNYIMAKMPMFSNARTLISTNERGFVKVIASKDKKKILGAQLMCENAGEIISEFTMALDYNMTIDDMLFSVRPHPSYCEVIHEVLEALQEKANAV